MPFLPLVFRGSGLSEGEVGLALAIGPLARTLTPTAWGFAADRLGRRTSALALSSLGCAASLVPVGIGNGLPMAATVMTLHGSCRAAHAPLADAIAHQHLGTAGHRFSRIRIWGSIGFVLGCLAVGALSVSQHPWRLVAVAGGLYLLGALSVFAITESAPQERRFPPPSLRSVFKHTGQAQILVMLAATTTYCAAHGIYDAFYGMHLRDLGFSDPFVALSFAVGDLAEIVLMWFAPRFVGPDWLFPCSLVAAIRWFVTGLVTNGGPTLLIQPLHGVTFGLWYLSLTRWVQQRCPEPLRATHQGLASSAMSIGTVVGFLGGGGIYRRVGSAKLFHGAAVVSLLTAFVYRLGQRLLSNRERHS